MKKFILILIALCAITCVFISCNNATTPDPTPDPTPITYAVTYKANDATSGTAPADQVKTQGTALTLATNSGNLTKTGYKFDGWNTKADGTGTDYAVGTSYTEDAALELFAKWTQVATYAVTYKANDATSGTVPADQVKTQETALILATNSGNLAKTGYKFNGWNTKADGTGTDYVVADSYTTEAALELYAKWTLLATYTVTYNKNEATSGTEPESQTKTEQTAITLAINSGNLVRTGYTFAGWNTKADGTGTDYAVGVSYTTEASVELFAKWTIISYNITYNMDEGDWVTGYTAKTTYTIKDNVTLPVAAHLIKEGYVFTGWYEKEDLSGNTVTAIVTGTTEHKTLYAKWITLLGTWVSNDPIPMESGPAKYVRIIIMKELSSMALSENKEYWNNIADETYDDANDLVPYSKTETTFTSGGNTYNYTINGDTLSVSGGILSGNIPFTRSETYTVPEPKSFAGTWVSNDTIAVGGGQAYFKLIVRLESAAIALSEDKASWLNGFTGQAFNEADDFKYYASTSTTFTINGNEYTYTLSGNTLTVTGGMFGETGIMYIKE